MGFFKRILERVFVSVISGIIIIAILEWWNS